MGGEKKDQQATGQILNQEQESILNLYLQHLDDYYEELKISEKLQVEIETLHLKKILSA